MKTAGIIGGGTNVDIIFVWLEFCQHELLLFGAVGLLIGAIDDFCVDLIWLCRAGFRRMLYYRQSPPLRAKQLPPPLKPGILAVFVPAWQEAAVIEDMLSRCIRAWGGGSSKFSIYVGCYPNDPDGIAAIGRAAAADKRIKMVISPHDGPTTKGDCLNQIWRVMTADELQHGYKVKAVILHDAEDFVHADELILYDYLLEKGHIVQLPVVPERVPNSIWISGHYCDEFAEAHGKSLVVREAIGASLPLAGVACAIDRGILGRLAFANGNQPFDQESLTEDYELGLRIGALGCRAIMARVFDENNILVATRACFPHTLDTAVRQKTRWLTGIALAGWDRLGWKGGLAEFWMRLRDRKAMLAAVILLAVYLCLLLTVVLLIANSVGLYHHKSFGVGLRQLLWLNGCFLLWRILWRAGFVAALYGPFEAILSVPRMLVSNVIAMIAARKAVMAYIRSCFGAPLAWDKTSHNHFPVSDQQHGRR